MHQAPKRRGLKRLLMLFMVMTLALGLFVKPVFANESSSSAVDGPVEVLRVDTSLNVNPSIPGHPAEESEPEVVYVYILPEWQYHPIQVEQVVVSGFNAIRRTYALPPTVNPMVICTEPLEMFGQTFNFAYVVQQHTAHETFKDLRYTVEVGTSSRDLATVMQYLELELSYDRDGFAGTLVLDIHSINTEVASQVRSASTVTRQRSFPHLSAPDNALIPRTIVDGGHTFHLASVEWVGQGGGTAIDGHQPSSSFTANATFTRQATSVRNTGYHTTAEYVGTVFRTTPGYTIFTAIFYGEPVIEVWIEEPVAPQSPVVEEPIVQQIPVAPPVVADAGSNNVASGNVATGAVEGAEGGNGFPMWILAVLGGALALVVAGAGGFFLCKKFFGNNVTIMAHHGPRDIVQAGKVKLDLDSPAPTISLDGMVSAKTGVYSIQIAKGAVSRLVGRTITVVRGSFEATQIIPYDAPDKVAGGLYEFAVTFADDGV